MINAEAQLINFGVRTCGNKKAILSTQEGSIQFPFVVITPELVQTNLQANIVAETQKYIAVSSLELIPQLINIYPHFESQPEEIVNIVYAFVVSHTESINNAYWIDFDYLTPVVHSNLLFETIQKLQ